MKQRSPTNTKSKKISKTTTSSNSSNSSSLSKSSPPPIKEHPTGASEDEVTSASEVGLPSSCRNCSSRSQDSEDDGHPHPPVHPLNFRSLQLENGKKSQLSPTNSNSDHSSTNKKCMNCNGGASSPSTASTTSTGKVSHNQSSLNKSTAQILVTAKLGPNLAEQLEFQPTSSSKIQIFQLNFIY